MRGFLSDCYRVEKLAEEIYQRLAVNRAYVLRVRDVFLKLSHDERSHASQVDMVMQASERDINAISRISWENIDTALQLAESMVSLLDQRRLDEEEALRLAVAMEQQFIKVHVHNAVHSFNERIAALFDELSKQDQAHLDLLRECLAWWHQERKAKN